MDHLSALRLRVIHELYKKLITISHELTRFFWTGARSSYVITSFGYIIQNSVSSLIFAHETLPSIYRKEKALFYRLKTQLFLKFLRKQKKAGKTNASTDTEWNIILHCICKCFAGLFMIPVRFSSLTNSCYQVQPWWFQPNPPLILTAHFI